MSERLEELGDGRLSPLMSAKWTELPYMLTPISLNRRVRVVYCPVTSPRSRRSNAGLPS